jgi:ATP-dependent Clp protease ATP-binding subunit ClpB
VFDVLLQVLDEGRLTDGQGRTVDFRNTILILTSNLGAGGSEEMVMAAVRSAFKPEFINRLDDVIIFDGLEPGDLVAIVDIQLNQLSKRLAQRRLTLEVSLPAKQWLAQRGFDPLYGARPLRRLVQQAIGDQLAKMLLAGQVHDGDTVKADVGADGEGLILS